jgi:DNA-binding transcriptional LysR family regulator
MDLNHAQNFVRVVDAGSFTAAAQDLGASKSFVSRSVSHLEEELGVRLLHRTTRSLQLTPAGRAYYERAKGAIESLDEAAEAVTEEGAEPRGLVRLTIPTDMGGVISETIAEFCRKHPKVRIEIIVSPRTLNLVDEGIDLAVRAGRMNDSSLVAKKIGASEARIFASPSYVKRRGVPRTLAEVESHAFVLYRGVAGTAPVTFDGPKGPQRVVLKGPVSVDEMSLVVALVRTGIGMGVLPVEVARRAGSHLVSVLPKYVVGGASLSIVYPSARHLPHRVALLRDALHERLSAFFGAASE